MKYKKIFLNKIKSLLSYFVGFFKDKFILSKIYPENFVINDLDQKLIIIII